MDPLANTSQEELTEQAQVGRTNLQPEPDRGPEGAVEGPGHVTVAKPAEWEAGPEHQLAEVAVELGGIGTGMDESRAVISHQIRHHHSQMPVLTHQRRWSALWQRRKKQQ